MGNITYHEIREECEGLVSQAREELGADAGEEAVRDYLQENIDGHEWVIYYNKAAQVCEAVSNSDSAWFLAAEDQFEEFGGIHATETFSYSILQTQLAYHCLSVKVFELLGEEVAA